MKKLLFTYILFSFIAIAIFGFFGFFDYHSSFTDCASSLTNTQMPPCDTEGSLAMSLARAETYLNFSLAILTVLALLLAIMKIWLKSFIEFARTGFLHLAYTHLDNFIPTSREKILKWFNTLQHPDPRLNF